MSQGRLSFRLRVTLLTAVAIAITVSATSATVWVISKHELYKQLDQSLSSSRPTKAVRSAETTPSSFIPMARSLGGWLS